MLAVRYTALSTSMYHTCGIQYSDGHVKCWGLNSHGQSGPVPNVSFAAVSTAEYHTCGIRRDDKQVVCWGSNQWRRLEVHGHAPA